MEYWILTIIESINGEVESVILSLLALSGHAVWLFNCCQLVVSTVIPSDLLGVRQRWWVLIQCEVYGHRFILHWSRENRTSILLLLLLHKLLLMLLDINLRLLLGPSANPGICHSGVTADPIERADSPQELWPGWYQWLLYVCVDLADHHPLIWISLDDTPAHTTQAVLYRLQCTITLNKYVN